MNHQFQVALLDHTVLLYSNFRIFPYNFNTIISCATIVVTLCHLSRQSNLYQQHNKYSNEMKCLIHPLARLFEHSIQISEISPTFTSQCKVISLIYINRANQKKLLNNYKTIGFAFHEPDKLLFNSKPQRIEKEKLYSVFCRLALILLLRKCVLRKKCESFLKNQKQIFNTSYLSSIDHDKTKPLGNPIKKLVLNKNKLVLYSMSVCYLNLDHNSSLV